MAGRRLRSVFCLVSFPSLNLILFCIFRSSPPPLSWDTLDVTSAFIHSLSVINYDVTRADGYPLSCPPFLEKLTIREAVRTKLISSGVVGADAYVVVAGPANVYGHYITTREEYSIQRYEGASTLFGPCECLTLPRFSLYCVLACT